MIWQAEANAAAIASLAHVANPANILNIAGPEILDIREVCEQFSRLMNKPLRLTGEVSSDAFLNDATKSYELFGRPSVAAETMIRWTADWVARGGESLGKPTHFETRDGKY